MHMSRNNQESVGKPPLTDEMVEVIFLKALLLFFMAVLIYIPAMNGGYIYDDDNLLYNNPAIRRGYGWNAEAWKGLWSFWLPVGADAAAAADYAPLADTTLWLEWRFWGNNGDLNGPERDPHFQGIGSTGYHITNIILHGIAALLLWYMLAQMGIPGAWLAALVWAVHPVCAESVAWISERRNTLSMGLFALTMISWFNFQRTRRWSKYYLAILLFILTMFAKTSIVMLPVVLLLCVWWMRNRVTWDDVLEAVPFFLISLIFGIITLYFQNYRAINKEFVPGFITNPIERIPSACFALGFYFYKIILPINLNLIYQQWHRTLQHAGTSPESILIALNQQKYVAYSFMGIAKELIIGVNFAAFFYWAWRRRDTWGRHAILGMGFFVIMIAPVLGFTRMAYMRLTLVSDHFQYAPMVGVIALCVAGLVQMYHRLQPTFRPLLVAVGVGFIGIFSCLTCIRAIAFSEPEKLWVDNLKKNPDSWQGHSHLGAIYWQQNNVKGALDEWEQSVIFAPYLYETHNNFALALNRTGDLDPANKQQYMDAALQQFKTAVSIDPDQFKVRTNYANALFAAGNYEQQVTKNYHLAAGYWQEAVDQYKEVLKFMMDPSIYDSMGVGNLELGKLDDAIQCFQRAIDIAKRFPANPVNQKFIDDTGRNLEQARLLRQKELETPPPESQNPAPAPAATPAVH